MRSPGTQCSCSCTEQTRAALEQLRADVAALAAEQDNPGPMSIATGVQRWKQSLAARQEAVSGVNPRGV